MPDHITLGNAISIFTIRSKRTGAITAQRKRGNGRREREEET